MFGLITYYFNKSHDSDNRSRMKCSFILQLNLQVTFNVFAKPILLFTLFPQILAKESNTVVSAAFAVKPDNEIYSHEDSNVLLEWQFRVGSWSTSPTKVREFLFGVWEGEHGYVKNKIVSVREHNSISIPTGYKRKVDWTGNIYDCVVCNATIRMYNLTAADFKTYGLEVDPQNLKKMPLKNWLTIVKFVPAKIVKWKADIKVKEGKATTVECKATGRPTPSVIIQRDNGHSLCNGTGHCLYKIPAANKSVHEGKYYCLVQQRNSSQIKRTLNLTVIPTRHMALNRTVVPAGDMADGSHTAVPRTELVAAMTGGVIVFALTISLKILYHLRKIHRNKDHWSELFQIEFETTKVEDEDDEPLGEQRH